MYDVEIDRSICKGCGACTKVSQMLYLDENNKIAVQGGIIDDDCVEILISSLHEIETAASICPKECFKVYDDDTLDEIKIKRHATI